jgi:hypothetical protein
VLSVCAGVTPPGCTYQVASRRLHADGGDGRRALSDGLGYVLVEAEVLFASPSFLSAAAAAVDNAPQAFSARLASALVNASATLFGSASLLSVGVLEQSGGGVSPPTQESPVGLLFSTVQVAGWVFLVLAISTLASLVALVVTRWRMNRRVHPSLSTGPNAAADSPPTAATTTTTTTTMFVGNPPVGGWVVGDLDQPQHLGAPAGPLPRGAPPPAWSPAGAGPPLRHVVSSASGQSPAPLM